VDWSPLGTRQEELLEPPSAQKVRLAQVLRRFAAEFLTHDCPEDLVTEIADTLDGYVERVARFPLREERKAFGDAASASDRRSFRENSPVVGLYNPIAPPLTLTLTQKEVTGEALVEGMVRFGWAYEGPPGHVHGGFVTAIFDELLGYAQTLSGAPGLTAKLTVRFRAPTPLHTDLRLVGLFDRTDGRRIHTRGQLFAGEHLTADATGLFVRLQPEHYEDLERNRQEVLRRAKS